MADKTRVCARINGERVEFLCEPHQSLLECLRDILALTGAKEGCNDGNCGACSVLLDGRLVNACLVLGVEIKGHEVTTVEGLADWRGPRRQTTDRRCLFGSRRTCPGGSVPDHRRAGYSGAAPPPGWGPGQAGHTGSCRSSKRRLF